MLPICPTCKNYYVRPPCPTCSEENERATAMAASADAVIVESESSITLEGVVLGDPDVAYYPFMKRMVHEVPVDQIPSSQEDVVETLTYELTIQNPRTENWHRFILRLYVLNTQVNVKTAERKPYYQAAQFALLFYDVTRPLTMHSIKDWITEVETSARKDTKLPMAVIGIYDPELERYIALTKEEGDEFSDQIGAVLHVWIRMDNEMRKKFAETCRTLLKPYAYQL